LNFGGDLFDGSCCSFWIVFVVAVVLVLWPSSFDGVGRKKEIVGCFDCCCCFCRKRAEEEEEDHVRAGLRIPDRNAVEVVGNGMVGRSRI
jgi:hypothetical protein